MKNSSPFFYGLFDSRKRVMDSLIAEPVGGADGGDIVMQGYLSVKQGDSILYIHSRIYNTEEVRTALGIVETDAAGIASAVYRKEGVKGFRRFNGKFTIIIRESDQTIVVRDRNGEGRMIYFTAEFLTDSYGQLFHFKNFRAEPDLTGIVTFLQIGYIPAPVTSLSGVQKVPAGEVLYHSSNGFRFEKLFDYSEIIGAKRQPMELKDAIDQYAFLLKRSLLRRIGDAGEVGVLLSGGYDSGGNLAMVREVFPGTIKTYSIGFRDNPASELPYAKLMADKFGSVHHEYQMDGSEIEFLPEIIGALGDPFSESGFMLNHSVMKMVSGENLPVAIGGDGNDQYFGAGIRETAWHYRMRRYGLAPLSTLFDKLSDVSMFDRDNLSFRIHFQNQKILKVMEPEIFGLHDYQLRHMFNLGKIEKHPYIGEIPHTFGSYDELWLQRNYFLHIRHSVNEVIIYKASRLSEHFGVHLSFSYTDLDIYHFLQQLPLNLRAKGTVEDAVKGRGVTKYIHKELVKPMLPKDVTGRAKQGGFSPLEIFFKNEKTRHAIYRYISQSAFAKTLKQPAYIDAICTRYEQLSTGKGYWFWYKQVKSNQMLNLLIIALWWDMVMERRTVGPLSSFLVH